MINKIKEVEQLSQIELSEINGGYWWIGLAVAIADTIDDIRENPDDFAAGYKWLDDLL